MLQAGESEAEEKVQEQNVGFHDEESGIHMDIPAEIDYTMSKTTDNTELGDYLNRPVLIYTKTWTEGTSLDPVTSRFDPWALFFDQVAIQKKLDNYYLIQCNINLKFVVNASPFYYGCALASYQPLVNFNPAPIVLGTGDEYNVSYSQRPHIYIYPQTSQGGTMTLPFLYHKEWLDVTTRSDVEDMGQVTLSSLTDLLNANSVAGSNCTIQVYAWASDVKLSGPTLKLALQTKKRSRKPKNVSHKDEYHHEGTISKPASAIARATGMLSDIPVVGPFMTATSYAADAISDIASLFGFTDVPVIDDVHEFKSMPLPQMACADIGIPIEKASLDSKNELTIDPKVCGVTLSDELMVNTFAQRESYLTTFNWDSSDVAGDHLFSMRVTPQVRRVNTITDGFISWNTPMGYMAECFKNWRGDIKVRLKFICSQYHRGRVKVSWDPRGEISLNPATTTEVFSKIIDITECSDVTLNIPYTQLLAYLETDVNRTSPHFSTTGFSTDNTYSNGNLCVSVITNQTSPIASADIKVAVFVSAGDNIEFANPQPIYRLYSPYAIQSKFVSYDDEIGASTELGVTKSEADPNINLVYMGEHISSIRQLFRRTTNYTFMEYNQPASGDIAVYRYNTSRKLRFPGYDADGIEEALGLTSGVAESYNWCNWHYMTWFELCFVGVRGSINYALNTIGGNNHDLWVSRRNDVSLSVSGYYASTGEINGRNEEAKLFSVYGARTNGACGQTVTNSQTQNCLHLSVPMYSPYKFQNTSSSQRTLGSTDDGTTNDVVQFGSANRSVLVHGGFEIFASAGADYNLIFFLNVPALFIYDSVPDVPTP
jgi:hypothetical protein